MVAHLPRSPGFNSRYRGSLYEQKSTGEKSADVEPGTEDSAALLLLGRVFLKPFGEGAGRILQCFTGDSTDNGGSCGHA